ncbi:MAG TPA: phenazine-specific anthranilate synthase component I, partial [Nocardioides sp.]|nr:phenazine-specific anthranilate synthase component I [Nocardioides sp.]
AGATLVRDSDPASEVAETHAKAGGILSAFGLVAPAPVPALDVAALARDEDVVLALHDRNRRLSRFWLTDQAGAPPDPSLRGRRVVVLDGEDAFVNMLRHVLGVLGMTTEVVRHSEIEAYGDRVLAADLVVVGPGPGDPRDPADPKVAALRSAVDRLLEQRRPFLAVCLGHQALCHRLGLDLDYKDIVFQGTQSPVDIDGRTERVGFYNTFVARATRPLPADVAVEADPVTGDVHLVRGPHFRGIQFHAESILTERGYDLLHDLVRDLVGR